MGYIEVPALAERMRRFPTFDATRYGALNPGLAEAVPDLFEHYVAHGVWENRRFCTPEGTIATLQRLSEALQPALPPTLPPDLAALVARFVGEEVGLYVHTRSDLTVRLQAELIARALGRLGIAARLRNERADPAAREAHCLFFAPHEFFFFEIDPPWRTDAVVSDAVLCPTVPVHAAPPSQILPLAFACRGILDGDPQNGLLYDRCGLPHADILVLPERVDDLIDPALFDAPLMESLAVQLPPDGAPARSWAERPLDFAFTGARSEVAEDLLSRGAARLSALDGFVWYPGPQPTRAPGEAELRQTLQIGLAAARVAKVLIDVAPGEIGPVHWYDMAVRGFLNRTLVVTNHRYRHPVFAAGEHFLVESPRRIPRLVEWLTRTPEGRDVAETVTARAYAAARAHGAALPNAARILDLLDRTRRTPSG